MQGKKVEDTKLPTSHPLSPISRVIKGPLLSYFSYQFTDFGHLRSSGYPCPTLKRIIANWCFSVPVVVRTSSIQPTYRTSVVLLVGGLTKVSWGCFYSHTLPLPNIPIVESVSILNGEKETVVLSIRRHQFLSNLPPSSPSKHSTAAPTNLMRSFCTLESKLMPFIDQTNLALSKFCAWNF